MNDDRNQTVCYCIGVSRGELLDAIRAGATDLNALVRATRACSGCGTCRWDVEDLLAAAQRAAATDTDRVPRQ